MLIVVQVVYGCKYLLKDKKWIIKSLFIIFKFFEIKLWRMHMDYKVHILMATYNGEKYIKSQIDSILKQTYKNIKLFVLDDGSTDSTVEILEKYEEQGKINIVRADNHLGYPYSYFELLKRCGDADFYGFSDQDDVWHPRKIERAMEMLSSADNSKPQLYFSAFEYADKDLNVMEKSPQPPEKIKFVDTFFQCFMWGFSVVFNEKMRQKYVAKLPESIEASDYWLHMLCGAFGEFHYDKRICAKHRRHGDNHSQDTTSFWKFQLWRFKYFFKENQFKGYHEMLKQFYKYYSKELPENQRKLLWLFQSDGHVLRKLFYPHRLRYKLLDEILLRMVFILRKL